ncbi:MAG TPA: cobyrinate a,c-diamide synthase [Polyangiaceae bacterium]|nr:cobyrinate a,c-diamide synthase [Polyangiaceae bacterium]
MRAPRLLIAGVSSGVGKTTFTLGLCAALRRRGVAVSVFKCGPDYLDPSYHRIASGRSVHNLDSWLMQKPALLSTFARQAGELSLIEGVMGLFDGLSPTGPTGSSAEIAGWLGAPVVLVCDASGMARSVAALAHGYATFDPDVNVAGLICNRIGSRGHLDLLRRACAARPGLPPLFGGLSKNPAAAFPERHLGLRSAQELDLSPALDAWAREVESGCDVDALIALAHSAPPLPVAALDAPARAASCRIGVADDAAFHFYYDANLHLLERAGATLVRFSPLADAACPDVDGIYIGGGYPELHAGTLAGNHGMLESLRAHARRGRPIYAECGGLMYLSDAIVTLNGDVHRMLGLVRGRAVMATALQALGYVEVETRDASPLGPAGTRFRGHQFRYSRLEDAAQPSRYEMTIARSNARQPEGYGGGHVLGSYVHAHWAESPEIPAQLVERCRQGAGDAVG